VVIEVERHPATQHTPTASYRKISVGSSDRRIAADRAGPPAVDSAFNFLVGQVDLLQERIATIDSCSCMQYAVHANEYIALLSPLGSRLSSQQQQQQQRPSGVSVRRWLKLREWAESKGGGRPPRTSPSTNSRQLFQQLFFSCFSTLLYPASSILLPPLLLHRSLLSIYPKGSLICVQLLRNELHHPRTDPFFLPARGVRSAIDGSEPSW